MKNVHLAQIALLAALEVSNDAHAMEPHIHTIVSKGTVFRHFSVALSAVNTLLPDEIPRRERLDDTAENFKYGQFEVFLPAKRLKLPLDCKGNYIVRMTQTLDEDNHEITRKQNLYYAIRDARHGRKKEVRVILELKDDPAYACNLFFRSDANGRYVNYVGRIKP